MPKLPPGKVKKDQNQSARDWIAKKKREKGLAAYNESKALYQQKWRATRKRTETPEQIAERKRQQNARKTASRTNARDRARDEARGLQVPRAAPCHNDNLMRIHLFHEGKQVTRANNPTSTPQPSTSCGRTRSSNGSTTVDTRDPQPSTSSGRTRTRSTGCTPLQPGDPQPSTSSGRTRTRSTGSTPLHTGDPFTTPPPVPRARKKLNVNTPAAPTGQHSRTPNPAPPTTADTPVLIIDDPVVVVPCPAPVTTIIDVDPIVQEDAIIVDHDNDIGRGQEEQVPTGLQRAKKRLNLDTPTVDGPRRPAKTPPSCGQAVRPVPRDPDVIVVAAGKEMAPHATGHSSGNVEFNDATIIRDISSTPTEDNTPPPPEHNTPPPPEPPPERQPPLHRSDSVSSNQSGATDCTTSSQASTSSGGSQRDKARDRLRYKARKMRTKMQSEIDHLQATVLTLKSKLAYTAKDSAALAIIKDKVIEQATTTNARKKLLHSVCSPTKASAAGLTSHLARTFGIGRKAMARKNLGRRAQKRKKARDTLAVMEFLCDPEHSIRLAGKKDCITCRYRLDGHPIRVKKNKVILTERVKELHQKYNRRNPNRQVSLTFFQGVRRTSQYIKPLDHAKADVCLCIKHQNFALKLRCLRQHCKIPDQPDTVVRKFSEDDFDDELKVAERSLPATVRYDEWRMKLVPLTDPKADKFIKKLRPVPMEMARADFIKQLKRQFPAIRVHVQIATEQHCNVRNQRENLREGEATMQLDFAQNWLVGFGEEVQSAFFAKDPVSVAPGVLHIRIGNQIIVVSICLVTDDRRHDAGAILAMLDKICEFIKKHYPFIKVIHFWSDSPSSQYRNISMFSIMCRHVERYGIKCTWSYFEAGHGKGPCDGVGAAAKRKADRAVKSGRNIQCARDFVENGNSGEGSVIYIEVPVVDSFACRDLLRYFVTTRKVPGTMTVHNVMVHQPGKAIVTRRLSCFRDCCWDATKFVPVFGRPCKTHAVWTQPTRHELYNKQVNAKLDEKRLQLEAEELADEQRRRQQRDQRTAEQLALARNADMKVWEKGEFVACVWGRDWWIAEVTAALVHSRYVVRFMHHLSYIDSSLSALYCDDSYYGDWPDEDDILDISHTDILCPVSKPRKATFEGFDCFSIPKSQVKVVSELFQSFPF